jgi:tRNA (cmo5U34)-methyltransferase
MTLDKNKDFTFNGIAGEFDAHVREQLPWYDMVVNIVCYLIRSYLQNGGILYDIGCSTGNIARKILDTAVSRDCEIIGIDKERGMFRYYPEHERVITFHGDCMTYNYEPYDAALLFLTCQFLDVNKRAEYLKQLYEKKKKNGIIIIVDKFLMDLPVLNHTGVYYNSVINKFNMLLKLENGINAEDILNKELSLTGVQVPLNRSELPGEDQLEFFAMGDFRGYVII